MELEGHSVNRQVVTPHIFIDSKQAKSWPPIEVTTNLKSWHVCFWPKGDAQNKERLNLRFFTKF